MRRNKKTVIVFQELFNYVVMSRSPKRFLLLAPELLNIFFEFSESKLLENRRKKMFLAYESRTEASLRRW